ncbi:hypothetical protein COCMIDRAFT_85714 [Bipolaris oryzae ATCC 44560]|uniref:Uncharacterized protein n=1 Tax=Bipolaris oryzae ATCC 44560 TaxID=930090 RepID=W6ZGL5_COCMI|nr:uncharacterized protein COCMIDRAFT_85714 [Bipolaris oryzae ATCC 44560]EUC49028.1 hypothetical protein COCMIDRAFT_85714 [Bipolaris oryzae ATCC 44560]
MSAKAYGWSSVWVAPAMLSSHSSSSSSSSTLLVILKLYTRAQTKTYRLIHGCYISEEESQWVQARS